MAYPWLWAHWFWNATQTSNPAKTRILMATAGKSSVALEA